MISENVSRYENVVVRNHKEIGINDYGLDYLVKIEQELERYKNIVEIHEKYFELINDLAFDYDGCETTGDLMILIDELKKYASLGRVANTTEVIYVSGNNKKYNILHEELKGE